MLAKMWKMIKENTTGGTGKYRLSLALLLIAGLTVAVYWPSLHNEFIDYDDQDYVTLNMMVRQGLTLKGFIWAFTAFHAGNWHPLTWLSHMVDIQLFDLNPVGHHATNILLHALNAMLLCVILHRLTGFVGRSLLVALLFAVHPLHVESVAWVAERKDVLSTLFFLLTTAAYSWYAHKPSPARYLSVCLLFTLGLMAKQMLVTLPLILLLVDLWPLRRLSLRAGSGEGNGQTAKALLFEKIPLLVLSAAASFLTLGAQRSAGALTHSDGGSTFLNIGNALLSYIRYIGNMFWPVDLALFYPFDASAVTPFKVAVAFALLAAITGVALMQSDRRPYLLFGWLWYLLTLLPVIGFIRAGAQAMADRYTYIPLIGLFLMLTWGGAEIAARWRQGVVLAGAAAAIVITFLSLLTLNQIRYWQNSFALFDHALATVENNWLAHNNMGILLARLYRNEEAVFHFRESVRLHPTEAAAFRNLGGALQATGRNAEAIEAFTTAVGINPSDAESHYRLGYAHLLAGNPDLAYQQFEQLKTLDENYARPLLDSIKMSRKP